MAFLIGDRFDEKPAREASGEVMQLRTNGYGWQKALWKIVSNPAIEVVAAIVIVLFAAWIVVQTDVELRSSPVPVLVAPR